MLKRFHSLILMLIILYLSIFSGRNIWHLKHIDEQQFDSFVNNMFTTEVQCDTLSLNFSLADPEAYGIKEPEVTLGDYGIQSMKEDSAEIQDNLEQLQAFDYNKLSSEQQLTYDILEEYLQQSLLLNDYGYYNETIGPATGIQAELPIILAEYNFYTKEDIDEYISLLPCVYDYFEDIVQYEREKSEQGLFMSDDIADSIIDQCKTFIKNPEDNFLIGYFNEKVASFDGLTQEEIEAYQINNKKAVLDYIIPAYELLIDSLTQLKGTGTNEKGLYYYPEGQAYYECLTKAVTGSDKSMQEMIDMLNEEVEEETKIYTDLSETDLKLVQSFDSFPITDPQLIIEDLKEKIKTDFPEAVAVNCNIKYVPESLADFLSPAMYLTSPIDRYLDNNIYINGSDPETLSMIYTTVAHEGYPGHMYQNVYFLSQNPEPIRYLASNTGYIEGWATYAEMYSYDIAGIDYRLADILVTSNAATLCMYGRADIGINYQGWSKDEVKSYFRVFSLDDSQIDEIYETLISDPAAYLPYTVGYLEIEDLKEKAELELGDQFNLKDFHQFLLDIGPAQFDIIEERLGVWINERKAQQ